MKNKIPFDILVATILLMFFTILANKILYIYNLNDITTVNFILIFLSYLYCYLFVTDSVDVKEMTIFILVLLISSMVIVNNVEFSIISFVIIILFFKGKQIIFITTIKIIVAIILQFILIFLLGNNFLSAILLLIISIFSFPLERRVNANFKMVVFKHNKSE